MAEPKDPSNFADCLIASEEIHTLVLKGGGAEDACQRRKNLDDLYEIVQVETHERTEAPNLSIDGAAAEIDVFAIDIR